MSTAPMRNLPPLFTTTALPDFTCPFTDSPLETSHAGPSSQHSPSSSPSQLLFPKLKLPIIPSSSTNSTDSEILSDEHTDFVRSPSLISHLFSRNTSSSCSTSSQATPTTPTAGAGNAVGVSGYCRPILRRPECTSTSTSASEDNGSRPFDRSFGLGLSSMTSAAGNNAPCITRKRSTLTFAVKCPTSDSCQSPQSSFTRGPMGRKVYSRSPARAIIPSWQQLDENDHDEEELDEEEDYEYDARSRPSPLFEENSESDDEGYEEDEEGGFTSDEDLAGTFTVPSSRTRWIPSSKWATRYSSPSTTTPRRKAATSGTSSAIKGVVQPTSDDESVSVDPAPIRSRGRQVSILTDNCEERCSRHRSPPPKTRRSSPPPCPPAARSPSALGLCRRRETQTEVFAPSQNRGWRSDDPSVGFGHASHAKACDSGNALGLSENAGPKQSILLPPKLASRSTSASTTSSRSPTPPPAVVSRRGSAPATSQLSLFSASGSSGSGGGAKPGLESFLRRGSDMS